MASRPAHLDVDLIARPQNAGRSQMAAALLDQHAEGRLLAELTNAGRSSEPGAARGR